MFKRLLLAVIFLLLATVMSATTGDGQLPVYPGAQVKKERSLPRDRATLRLNGSLVGSAYAQKYVTQDDPAAVLAFYRNELGRAGAVTQCEQGQNTEVSVAVDDQTSQSLASCRSFEFGKGETGLKAGHPDDFYMVSVRAVNAGTEITVVRVQKSKKIKGAITV
jgi:hypothetical protein